MLPSRRLVLTMKIKSDYQSCNPLDSLLVAFTEGVVKGAGGKESGAKEGKAGRSEEKENAVEES